MGELSVQPTLPKLNDEFEMHVVPKAILGRRWNLEGGREERLVKWEDQPKVDATWVERKVLEEQFPAFHLEDKVDVQEGGTVRPPIIHAYYRRAKREMLKLVEQKNQLEERLPTWWERRGPVGPTVSELLKGIRERGGHQMGIL